MHLLVLSAFRLLEGAADGVAVDVSMHLLVLSAFRRAPRTPPEDTPTRSQRTFWRSVLSDGIRMTNTSGVNGLNAPSGAERFPTLKEMTDDFGLGVSMHLLVLSAFRPMRTGSTLEEHASQCTFWCSVLSDGAIAKVQTFDPKSQCTFWCSVLSDLPIGTRASSSFSRLNAPSGAQCFPT